MKVQMPEEIHKIIYKDSEPIAEADLFFNPKICVFVDGPDHDKDYIRVDDEKKRTKLKKLGYKVISIHHLNLDEGFSILINSIYKN